MHLVFKYKLRSDRKQEQAMRNFSWCCRFAYNALLAQEKEDYQEHLEEVESRQYRGGYQLLSCSSRDCKLYWKTKNSLLLFMINIVYDWFY